MPGFTRLQHGKQWLLERSLYARAESFASALLAGDTARFAMDHLQTLITNDLRLDPPAKGDAAGDPDLVGSGDPGDFGVTVQGVSAAEGARTVPLPGGGESVLRR